MDQCLRFHPEVTRVTRPWALSVSETSVAINGHLAPADIMSPPCRNPLEAKTKRIEDLRSHRSVQSSGRSALRFYSFGFVPICPFRLSNYHRFTARLALPLCMQKFKLYTFQISAWIISHRNTSGFPNLYEQMLTHRWSTQSCLITDLEAKCVQG